MLCGLGFLSAIVVSFLDVYGVRQLGDTENLKTESKKVVSFLFSAMHTQVNGMLIEL